VKKISDLWTGLAIAVCALIGVTAGLAENVLAAVMTINVLIMLRENLDLERSHAEVVKLAEKALRLCDWLMERQPLRQPAKEQS
jgi:4-hydroxybenzoate polyprenyltransferase